MKDHPVGRSLAWFRVVWHDLAFRSIVLGTLLIVAAVFVSRPAYEPGEERGGKHQARQKAGTQVESSGFFGIAPDAWTAIFTGVLTGFTGLLAATATMQIRFLVKADETARISADAARKAAEVAERTLIASYRPWLRVNVSLGDQPLLILPSQASASVAIFIHNTGNVPAIHVDPHAWMLIWRTEPGLDPYTEHLRRCEEARASSPRMSFTLFPGETFPAVVGSEMWMLNVTLGREAIDAGMKGVQPAGHAMLLIGGCVVYGSTSYPEKRHLTPFLHRLMSYNGTLVAMNRESTPSEKLSLEAAMNGIGNAAD